MDAPVRGEWWGQGGPGLHRDVIRIPNSQPALRGGKECGLVLYRDVAREESLVLFDHFGPQRHNY
jgi:hypothetical protein